MPPAGGVQVPRHGFKAISPPSNPKESWLDRTLSAYYDDLRASDLLTVEEERRLFAEYRSCSKCSYLFTKESQELQKCPKCRAPRNHAARNRLVEGALLFVIRVAKKYARRVKGEHYNPELLKTLVSAGNWGLLIAVDKFSLAKRTRFLTYAAWWIQERIRFELDSMGLIHVPVYRQKAIRARRRMGDPVKTDPAVLTLEDLECVDGEPGQQNDTLERNLIQSGSADVIQKALMELGLRGRDKYIVLAYYGYRTEPQNLRQISKFLGISSERVRQIKVVLLDQLKGYLEQKNLRMTEDIICS